VCLIVRVPASAEPERRYVLRLVLEEWLGLRHRVQVEEREDVAITAAGAEGELLVRDVFLATPRAAWLRPQSLPEAPSAMWTVGNELETVPLVDRCLPVLFGHPVAQGTFVRMFDRRFELGIDVFGSIFFAVSRYEETIPGSRDAHGRFPDHLSLAVRAGFADRPLVNEYVEVLWGALVRVWPRLGRRRRRFRFLPSHDVDFPFCREGSPLALGRRLGADVLVRRDLGLAARRLVGYGRGPGIGPRHDLCDTYDCLMQLSEEAHTASTFHFFGERTGLAIDGDYTLSDPPIRRVLRRIVERGHEIGLHASYRAGADADALRRQLDALRAACRDAGRSQAGWGCRSHYLRWQAPATWQALEDAALTYDATLGFSATAGFRSGCCYEFPVFNLLSREELKLRERPLIAMEVALLDRQKMPHDRLVERLVLLARRCKLFGGDFTLLWHNSRLQSRADRDAYVRIVRAVADL
jgi:hypothetical protein